MSKTQAPKGLGRHGRTERILRARRVRTVLAWMLRSPLARLLGPSMLLLDRSERRSRVPLLYAPAGDMLWVLVTDAESTRWWHDLVDEQPVALWMRGHPRSGRAQVVSGATDPDLARRGWAAYAQHFPATVARLGARVAHTVLVRIRLNP